MKDLTELFNNLKLLYYEYDKYENKFIKDQKTDKNTIYKEFIKLTYYLSKNEIQFMIDENSDIVICKEQGIFSGLKQRVKNLIYTIKKQNKNIYILNNEYIKHAKNLPVINTQTLNTKFDISEFDALIFTSKNAVSHLDSITKQWKEIPAYAISTQTAKEIKRLGGNLAYTGLTKYGDEFAKELISKLPNKKCAYFAAKELVTDLQNILNTNNIYCEHIPIYETVCVEYEKKLNLPKDSIIIFSSPSTIKYFLKNFNWQNSFKAISIGKTTAKNFPNYIKPIIADNTSLQSCVIKALNI